MSRPGAGVELADLPPCISAAQAQATEAERILKRQADLLQSKTTTQAEFDQAAFTDAETEAEAR